MDEERILYSFVLEKRIKNSLLTSAMRCDAVRLATR